MKILIMVHALTGGGAERVAVSWANGLAELGHKVMLLSTTDGQTYVTNSNVEIIERKIILKKDNSIGLNFLEKF